MTAKPYEPTPDWPARPFRVLMVERYDGWPRKSVIVPLAIGPVDACNQAQQDHLAFTALKAEEVAS